MRSRLVILTMLVFGMLLSTAGAGLAITGLSGNPSASSAEYAATSTPTPSSTPRGNGGGVLGDTDEGGGQNVSPEDNGGNAPSGGSAPSGGNGTQPSRQVEAGSGTGGNSLPFTGFAAIPILFGGLVLLGSGLVLRSRARQN